MPRWISCQSFADVPVETAVLADGRVGEAVQFVDRELAVEEAAEDGAPALGAEIDGEVLGHKALSMPREISRNAR